MSVPKVKPPVSETEEKETSQKATQPESSAPSESVGTPTRVMSSTDSLVADLIKEQPTAEEVMARKVIPRKIPNLLEIPEECLPLHRKQYRYAWLNKDKDLSAAISTRGWVLCNRTNSPHIREGRFSTHGGVECSGMLLAFMSEEAYKMNFEVGPAERSSARIKHLTEGIFKNQDKDAPISIYKPEPDESD